MSRTPLSFYSSYYIDTKVDPAAVTNYGGIFPYLDLMLLVGLPRLVSERLPKKGMRAWRHAEHVAALLALNLTGGDCVDEEGQARWRSGDRSVYGPDRPSRGSREPTVLARR